MSFTGPLTPVILGAPSAALPVARSMPRSASPAINQAFVLAVAVRLDVEGHGDQT